MSEEQRFNEFFYQEFNEALMKARERALSILKDEDEDCIMSVEDEPYHIQRIDFILKYRKQYTRELESTHHE